MNGNERNALATLAASAKTIQQGIDQHCSLAASLLDGQVEDLSLHRLLDMGPGRSRELRLETVLKETIAVLEESRKAFKSRRLEALRKKLASALMDSGQAGAG